MTTLKLWERGTPGAIAGQGEPTLEPRLLPGDALRGAVVVLPGGGYHVLAPHEAEPIAAMLNAAGFHAFILRYRLAPAYRWPAMFEDARRAVRLVRHRAGEFHVKPDRVGCIGFSAGGHLALLAGTLFDAPESPAAARDAIDRESARPDAIVLGYAVTSLVAPEYGKPQLAEALLGPGYAPGLAERLSAEALARPDMPPAFLWHTANDPVVHVGNTLGMAARLRRAGVPFAVHVYPDGPHGMGLATEAEDVRAWTRDLAAWLRGLGF